MTGGWTVVLDVGKTHSKATLWNDTGNCVARRTRANSQVNTGSSLNLDTAGIERWLRGVLSAFAQLGPIAVIVPVAHGAGVALIRNGQLQTAPLDYEWPGVGADRIAYLKQRDPFLATGSPALPAGLNIGMQLHWLESLRAADFRSGEIVPWAQYWAWVLCGVTASEISSLGCHTDLWRPYDRAPSQLAVRRGWAGRLARLMPANSALGTLTTEWVEATGLSRRVEVYCGMHDSNAALLAARSHPELAGHDATVLSTGTWFVAMRTPAAAGAARSALLPEARDCLLNVDVVGTPIPSSRFMGGREIEILAGAEVADAGVVARHLASAIKAVDAGEMIIPPCVPGVGPFPTAKSRSYAISPNSADRTALAHLYAAMIADVSLDLIGSRDTLLIDGRFSASPVFAQALANLRPTMAVLISTEADGVAQGALRLANVTPTEFAPLQRVPPLAVDMSEYRARWRKAAEGVSQDL
jgi:sugar (pentulose or hexulose) kinase